MTAPPPAIDTARVEKELATFAQAELNRSRRGRGSTSKGSASPLEQKSDRALAMAQFGPDMPRSLDIARGFPHLRLEFLEAERFWQGRHDEWRGSGVLKPMGEDRGHHDDPMFPSPES